MILCSTDAHGNVTLVNVTDGSLAETGVFTNAVVSSSLQPLQTVSLQSFAYNHSHSPNTSANYSPDGYQEFHVAGGKLEHYAPHSYKSSLHGAASQVLPHLHNDFHGRRQFIYLILGLCGSFQQFVTAF